MLSIDEILSRKIADRCCRRDIKQIPDIIEIIKECCEDLGNEVPKIICCETLTRSLSAFYLRHKPYLIYDSCLLEGLYIFDSIVLTQSETKDFENFFFKLIGEELIRNGNIPWSMYFAGKYTKTKYTFEESENYDSRKIQHMISLQSYFLIGHELGHLSVGATENRKVPDTYCKFINACMKVLTDRVKEDYSFEEFIEMRYSYFIEDRPQNIEEYWSMFFRSPKYIHFIEECYCDWNGVKLLLEHYTEPEESVNAISYAFNYLILQEAIRSDISNDRIFFEDKKHPVSRSMYFAVLRMEILLLTIQFNNLGTIENNFREIQDHYKLMDYWLEIIKKIPSLDSFRRVTEKDLPNMDKDKIVNILLSTFYYAHIV